MLRSLHIENIAVIKKIDVDFDSGFSALTGETGAGKSIIIDSINLLLGKKSERELIRDGESSAMVSGLFSDLSEQTLSFLQEHGISTDEDGSLLIQRVITQDGHSQIKINGRSANLSVLRAITPNLAAIHGQSESATLSDPEKQLEIIDVYAKNEGLLSEYSEVYRELTAARREIDEIAKKEVERERLIEILKYQIADIDSLSLTENEEDELIDRKLKIKNSEKIQKNAGFVFKALKGSEKGSVSFLIDKSITALTQISDVVPTFSEYSENLRDMLYRIEDIAEDVYSTIADMEEDPTHALNEIESRLDKISKLKRKYGLTVKDILAFKARAEAELDTLLNSESKMKELSKKERALYESAAKLADELHNRRCAAANEIQKKVKETLEFLDMPKVVFYASIEESYQSGDKVLSRFGSDSVEFYISPNVGAEAKPLSKIASGGELARVMLALKSVLSDKDGTETLIFDEIDAGVSGKTARKIGIKMLDLAARCQVFSVTHSAQIASLADRHFFISKAEHNGVTETSVSILDREGQIAELSRILGGINVTDAQRRAAIDMLDERNSYK